MHAPCTTPPRESSGSFIASSLFNAASPAAASPPAALLAPSPAALRDEASLLEGEYRWGQGRGAPAL